MMTFTRLKLAVAAALMCLSDASMAFYQNEYAISMPTMPDRKDTPITNNAMINRNFTRSRNRAQRRNKKGKHS